MSVVVENLTVRYGDLTAVNDVSFEAPTGAVTVVLGPNGAGKTSTIEVCEGFRTPAQGTIRVLGLNPATQHGALTQKMGVMLQGGGVYPSARVGDVIRHFCALYGKKVDSQALIEQVGLTSRVKSTWRRLSGGEQQRIDIARALLNSPKLILADEPTGNLDPETTEEIMNLLFQISKDLGTAIVMATHDYIVINKYPARMIRTEGGKVIDNASIAS